MQYFHCMLTAGFEEAVYFLLILKPNVVSFCTVLYILAYNIDDVKYLAVFLWWTLLIIWFGV